jgi:hypothetical protein
VADCLLEFGDKKGPSVQDNTVREAIEALYVTEKDSAKVNSYYSRVIR